MRPVLTSEAETAVLGAVRSVERSQRLPPAPDAVPAARALLREVLAGGPLAHRLEDGGLALDPADESVRVVLDDLDVADRLRRTGRLLLTTSPQAVSDVRRSSLRRILAQRGS